MGGEKGWGPTQVQGQWEQGWGGGQGAGHTPSGLEVKSREPGGRGKQRTQVNFLPQNSGGPRAWWGGDVPSLFL